MESLLTDNLLLPVSLVRVIIIIIIIIIIITTTTIFRLSMIVRVKVVLNGTVVGD